MDRESAAIRTSIARWLGAAIEAVEPARLTALALASDSPGPHTIIAIGKAAPAMCRGAAEALGEIEGICISATESDVPPGIDLMVGDHPVPGEASYRAGRRALEVATSARGSLIVLVSGGGSSLCEWPRPGVDHAYLSEVNRNLIMSGCPIQETNLVRGHLSALKCGGLARAARGEVSTYVLSDVAGANPGIVASGPTLPMDEDWVKVRDILERIGMEIPKSVLRAIQSPSRPIEYGRIQVVGDGKTAANALVAEATSEGFVAQVASDWLTGELSSAVDRLFDTARRGVTVAAGETSLSVGEPGRGGRNTHAALLASSHLAGTGAVFAAFATDGVDGSSGAAGALVDGDTLDRGGDPTASIEAFDSATYLESTGDLIVMSPTGTNVADLWVLWRP